MSDQSEVDLFHEALNYSLKILRLTNVELKEKQYEVLKCLVFEKKDVLAVLPTGYGKSLIYQLLPSIWNFMACGGQPKSKKSTVIVIPPLNALIHDQIIKMREGGLSICVLRGDRVATDEGFEEVLLDVPIEELRSCTYDLVFTHPEVLIENRKVFAMLKTPQFREKVRAVVVDEAHLVVDWKDFRPAYGKLGSLGSIFFNKPFLALTATATKATQRKIEESLGMLKATTIVENPDRGNIYFSSSRRGNKGDGKLVDILKPLVEDLRCKRLDFPLTIVYGNLETISSCYAFFSDQMESEQYEPQDAPKLSRNRLFTQYHAQYPEHERQRVVDELVQGTSKLRIIFATVAFGIGLDINNIRQVIHIGVPYSMEEYFQETGRAGRDGLPAKAHLYFNSYDISKGKKQLSETMRAYTQSKKCKREIILNYFGFKVPERNGALHECCDYHEEKCDCDDCVISTVSTMFEETKVPSQVAIPDADRRLQLDPASEIKLREELNLFRLSLPGSGRSAVGGTSLCSSITINLIDQVINNIHLLTSVEKIESTLPVYSRQHATVIWNILQKYLR